MIEFTAWKSKNLQEMMTGNDPLLQEAQQRVQSVFQEIKQYINQQGKPLRKGRGNFDEAGNHDFIDAKEHQIYGVVTHVYHNAKNSGGGGSGGAGFSGLGKEIGAAMSKQAKVNSEREARRANFEGIRPEEKDTVVANLQKVMGLIHSVVDEPLPVSRPEGTPTPKTKIMPGTVLYLYNRGMGQDSWKDLKLANDGDQAERVAMNLDSRLVQFRIDRGTSAMKKLKEFDITNEAMTRAAIEVAKGEMEALKRSMKPQQMTKPRDRWLKRQDAQKKNNFDNGVSGMDATLGPSMKPTPDMPPIPLAKDKLKKKTNSTFEPQDSPLIPLESCVGWVNRTQNR